MKKLIQFFSISKGQRIGTILLLILIAITIVINIIISNNPRSNNYSTQDIEIINNFRAQLDTVRFDTIRKPKKQTKNNHSTKNYKQRKLSEVPNNIE